MGLEYYEVVRMSTKIFVEILVECRFGCFWDPGLGDRGVWKEARRCKCLSAFDFRVASQFWDWDPAEIWHNRGRLRRIRACSLTSRLVGGVVSFEGSDGQPIGAWNRVDFKWRELRPAATPRLGPGVCLMLVVTRTALTGAG